MPRNQSCPSGLAAYKKKSEVPVAEGDPQPRRCDRCRFWHTGKKNKRRDPVERKSKMNKRQRPSRGQA